MGNDVQIIKLLPEEWEMYKDIRLEGLREDPQAFGSSLSEEETFPKEKWIQRISNPFNFVAMVGNKPIGTVSAYVTEEKGRKIAHIVGVFVSKEARGKGVGSKLFDTVLNKIKLDKEVEKIDLTVNKEQKAAVSLYEKYGFKISGEERLVLGDGFEHEEYTMVLEI